MVIHKDFADFVLFLYIHMAYADGSLHDKEREIILSKMTKLYPAENDYNNLIANAEKEYKSVGKSNLTQMISDTFRKFPSVKFTQKYKVYADMFDIINADGKIEESETAAMEELKKIIDLSAEATHS